MDEKELKEEIENLKARLDHVEEVLSLLRDIKISGIYNERFVSKSLWDQIIR